MTRPGGVDLNTNGLDLHQGRGLVKARGTARLRRISYGQPLGVVAYHPGRSPPCTRAPAGPPRKTSLKGPSCRLRRYLAAHPCRSRALIPKDDPSVRSASAVDTGSRMARAPRRGRRSAPSSPIPALLSQDVFAAGVDCYLPHPTVLSLIRGGGRVR